jgi:serine phosphatase RsbU (regulator of sigma subunit)
MSIPLPPSTAPTGFAGLGPRILICEDEGLTRLRLTAALRADGYQVVGAAADGENAVALARELRPDAILMDVNMPVTDGIEATRRIMAERPVPVVVLTAYSDADVIRQALEAGASGYLVKPLRDAQLVPAISVAMAQFAAVQAGSQRRGQAQMRAEEAERREREFLGRIAQERREARILAESLLSSPPELPGFDLAAVYEPAYAASLIGGDYFDFFELPGERLGIVVGDACGKGASAAAYMAKVKYMLRAYAAEDPSPASAIRRLNRALCVPGAEDPSFITLVYAVLAPGDRRLTFTNAGHPPPQLCRPGEAACLELPATGGVLGVIEDFLFEQDEVILEPGSALALFTDGVTEARSNGEMLGQEGIRAALIAHVREDAAAIAARILARAHQAGGGSLQDDAAIVVVRSLAPLAC